MDNKVYQIITDRVISGLQQNFKWTKNWTSGLPKNFISNKEYRGVNLLLLSFNNYKSNLWLTFNQVKFKKGFVKKGEKSTPIIFWNFKEFERDDGNGEKEKYTIPILRYYNVFNIEQTNLEIPKKETNKIESIKECEIVIEEFKNKPEIKHGGSKAYYSPEKDFIQLPNRNDFKNSGSYYEVLFHELTHSTGHDKRLSRDLNGNFFGDKEYSKEELTAELGSSFLSAKCEIDSKELKENSQAYINSWIKVLGKNPKWIIEASSKAQKSTDYILNKEIKK